MFFSSHKIHICYGYIYLHLVDFDGKLVGKYTSLMDPMGNNKYPAFKLSTGLCFVSLILLYSSRLC